MTMRFGVVGGVLLFCAVMTLLSGCGNSGSTAKVDVPTVDLSQFSPREQVFECVRKGDLRTLESLIQSDPRLVNVRGPARATPLHFAAVAGETKIVKFLLDHGANPRLEDEDGFTAAARAAQEGNDAIASLLRAAEAQAAQPRAD